MVVEAITGFITDLVTLVFGGYEEQMISLMLYTIGMAVYGVVIWNYYRHLAKKDIFEIDLSKYRRDKGKYVWLKQFFDALGYILKYIIVFPLFSFLWFAVISVLLFFLAKTQTVETIFLISITLVSAVRITAYYNEDLSKDLAKMIPFALLGIFIVSPDYLLIETVKERILSIPLHIELISRYLLFTVLLEFGLRLTFGFVSLFQALTGETPVAETESPEE